MTNDETAKSNRDTWGPDEFWLNYQPGGTRGELAFLLTVFVQSRGKSIRQQLTVLSRFLNQFN